MYSPWYVLYTVSQLDLLQVVVVSVAKRRGGEMDLGAVTCLVSQGYRHLKGSGIGKIFERLGFGGGRVTGGSASGFGKFQRVF